MSNNDIVLYGIGGLGADHRVFKFLTLDIHFIPIIWIEPKEKESLSLYASRIADQIDEKKRFGLLGVSFGGIVAMELNRIVKPVFTILISSASKSSELPRIRSLVRKLNIINFLPNLFLKPPFFLLNFLFGANNSNLLRDIINDTDIDFLRWAIQEIVRWNFKEDISNLHQIHGSKDRLIPLKNNSATVINNDGHFMIVDRAAEVTKIVNDIIRQYL